MSALELCGVTAGYGHAPAVRDLDLSVSAGEVVALLGPNGAGKTTTLRTAAGLVKPDGGEVRAFGRPIARRVERNTRAGVVLVPDNRAIFADLTVRENLLLARGSRDGGMSAVLDRLPRLKPLVGRKVGLLSGGEQQMLALGKALLAQPRVLLIDELSMGLAPVAVQELLPIVRALADDLWVGVLLVEQHVDLALSVADRAVVLHHGKEVLRGSAAELRADRDAVHRAYFGEAEAAEPSGERPVVETVGS
ncbi:branched-chain amino acid transport system ATP-binding protein [Mumia flava]|uniref:Branched-chain amino acid transport system ATP-binding protein n=1 Tax=Mumia flava TaxID=1348852 RepID=A0A2M9BIM6_9ACTN|nr:ABC transporter ATP-binding protein [Mumia flava]PJJ57800.1 branched-chain amino acid transport system ATP-binding protein [Mumia flava]